MNEGQIGDVFGCTDDVAELRRLAREQGRQSGATLREYMDICEAQSSEIFSLRDRIHALETALNRCLIGGNHIAGVLIDRLGARFSTDYPPGSEHRDVRAALTSQEDYEIWCCWNALMCARSVLSEKTAGKPQEATKPQRVQD